MIKLNSPIHIILSNNSSTNLNKLGIKIFALSYINIPYLLHSSPQQDFISDTGVYLFHYKDCKLKYKGETSRNVRKRIYEHRRDIRLGNLNCALPWHISKTDLNFDFNTAIMLADIHNKRVRQFFEIGAISLFRFVTIPPFFFSF